jgi:hypothetical protein
LRKTWHPHLLAPIHPVAAEGKAVQDDPAESPAAAAWKGNRRVVLQGPVLHGQPDGKGVASVRDCF